MQQGSDPKGYYARLGVSSTASAEEIRSAFRRLAMQWHPDRNKAPGAETKFKEINAAYQVLSDPNLRRTYDQASSPRPKRQASSTGQPQPPRSDPTTSRTEQAWARAGERYQREQTAGSQQAQQARQRQAAAEEALRRQRAEQQAQDEARQRPSRRGGPAPSTNPASASTPGCSGGGPASPTSRATSPR